MLFSSKEFIVWFLPLTLIGFFILGHWKRERAALAWLLAASLLFYAWWRAEYLALLIFSIGFNYAVGRHLAARRVRPVLIIGIAVNLAVLAYFKYSFFVLDNVNALLGTSIWVGAIALPIGISFFTFQQIAYLVDTFDGVTKEANLLNYGLFVSFFPQLIAGPIVHHKEMLPQLRKAETFHPQLANLSVGFTLFALGLFKKVVLADQVSVYADQVYAAAALGESVTLLEAWGAALAFTLQIYFDFSGYSDMAIGLGRMFGVRLPINFNSPLKAASIIEFWSRWHITLTRFLTSYVYNPITLALTRRRLAAKKEVLRRGTTSPAVFMVLVAYPLMVTMFLSGLWHGAGFQFLVWGLLHGAYLVVNHAWRMICHGTGLAKSALCAPLRPLGVLLTFTAVVVSLVYFRAGSVAEANALIEAMFGFGAFHLPLQFEPWLAALPPEFASLISTGVLPHFDETQVLHLAILLIIVWVCPNTQQWLDSAGIAVQAARSAVDGAAAPNAVLAARRDALLWHPSVPIAIFIGGVFGVAMLYVVSEAPSRFLYFDF